MKDKAASATPPDSHEGASFTPHQRERLKECLHALKTRQIYLRDPGTRLFPMNLSTAFFVNLVRDPVLGLPRVLAYRAVDEGGRVVDAACWAIVTEDELPAVRQSFSNRFLTAWKKSIADGKGPHLFHFGEGTWQGLREWAEEAGSPNRLSFLWEPGHCHHTDLRRLIRERFDLPIPGRLTLFALDHVLGLTSSTEKENMADLFHRVPESLFHPDPEPYIPREEWEEDEKRRSELIRYHEALLALQEKVWKWAHPHLESDWEQTEWGEEPAEGRSPGAHYLHFLEEEKRLREEDILALQEYSLAERVDRFRAIGPLTFLRTSLDEEGRFLYHFQMEPENELSKFREGDFLKLAVVGTQDIQGGFPVILADYNPAAGKLSVLARQGRLPLNRQLAYSLEEDLTDWNHPKLTHAVRAIFSTESSAEGRHSILKLLAGEGHPEFIPVPLTPTRSPKGFKGEQPWEKSGNSPFSEVTSPFNSPLEGELRGVFLKDMRLFQGTCPPPNPKGQGRFLQSPLEQEREKFLWVRNWMQSFEPVSGLNAAQRAALELPFRKRVSLIEGPPGTGKTHLLAWILIALILQAQETGEPLRIAVSALTHQAIDGVLEKVVNLVNRHRIKGFRGRIMKWGRYKEGKAGGNAQNGSSEWPGIRIEPLNNAEDISGSPYLILGSTGFGLYNLLDGRNGTFPQVFDWIVFDEASQVLLPHALLSLLYGKGNFLFLGDVKQLPPIVLGRYEAASPNVRRSILGLLLDRYGPEHRVRLDRTYRMNAELCAFPSRMWYEGALQSDPRNAASRLELTSFPASSSRDGNESLHRGLINRILDPEKPVALVLTDHQGNYQRSDPEVEIMVQLAHRLMTHHGLGPNRLALISPHRAQNNAMANRLSQLLQETSDALPVIDTVERLQGAERDVILFSTTTSDPDHVMSEFLNNPNRFNVAITRARHKLIVVGSRSFFLTVPQNEEALAANACFKQFLQHCKDKKSLFAWNGD